MRNSPLFSLNKNTKLPRFAHSGRKPATQVLDVPQAHLRSGARLSSQTARNRENFGNKAKAVDVLFYFNGRDQYARPVRLTWDDTEYELGGVQFWYAEHKGSVLVHHYRIGDESGDYTFELSLETENLTWRLERATKASDQTFTMRRFAGATS